MRLLPIPEEKYEEYRLSAMFAQTKRFPFVWDAMEQNGISMETWRKLLPETPRIDSNAADIPVLIEM